eukprot:scaffold6815_cov149-Ochromonas_danica.AAC.1
MDYLNHHLSITFDTTLRSLEADEEKNIVDDVLIDLLVNLPRLQVLKGDHCCVNNNRFNNQDNTVSGYAEVAINDDRVWTKQDQVAIIANKECDFSSWVDMC